MINSKDYNFSFSGLKTAVLYLVRDLTHNGKKRLSKDTKAAIAAEFQQSAVDVLVKKTIRAAQEYQAKTILLGGGVSANQLLRSKLGKEIKKYSPNTKYLIPDTRLTGDNALMIAAAAYFCGKPRISTSAAAFGGKNAIAEVVLQGKKKARDKVRADANARLDDKYL